MSTLTEQSPVKSGAAGAAQFSGWDSRKYNYFEPKGRKASHYEDMTVDVQPDPNRYLLQDWILAFADGTPTYSKTWTAAKSSDWHQFRAVDEEWERTHYQRQSTIVGMITGAIQNARRSGAVKRFDKTWIKVLEQHLGAYKHAEFGLGTATMHAQRYGYTQMINSAILTNASYKLRFAQDLTLYLGEIALDLPNLDLDAGKQHWLTDPIWQDTRRAIETIGGATDFLEKYFAVNVVFEPLVADLFRSGFIMQVAASQNDFLTPTVVSAAEGDYERNLANAVELFHMLANDPQHGEPNRKLFGEWLEKHGALASAAAKQLQSIWSIPHVKTAHFNDCLNSSIERAEMIAREIGVHFPSSIRA
ncbi:Propane 2-monooxygenase, hydroxylase component small subunit [Paraburkholderia sediminicola]|uniref:Propane 2-monooxygenase, hydroxylase component small subunit n=1 Tax=Paraburkholderia sediminicola TaxID=458836 RepID=A0A6J5CQH5_9BURK|nr:aromatic/alkene monooxygenase hydroxylase subunit beta [Paraburkholderia sediminicola]CAB3741188.1 Propane 2-monooxygenase, hydroxylase component small subunit [Paraburkholderia sediminicola]